MNFKRFNRYVTFNPVRLDTNSDSLTLCFGRSSGIQVLTLLISEQYFSKLKLSYRFILKKFK